jgi:hypothetical protein
MKSRCRSFQPSPMLGHGGSRIRCAGRAARIRGAFYGIPAEPGALTRIHGACARWDYPAARLLGVPQRHATFSRGITSEVDGAAISVKHGLVHRLGDRRVREDRADQLALGRLQRLGDRVALDQFGYPRRRPCAPRRVRRSWRSNTVFDHALGLAERDRLAVADNGKVPDFYLVARRRAPPSRSGRRWRPAAGSRCSPGCC